MEPEGKRQKATPEQYPAVGPVTIQKAYQELTHEGFAVWLRLMVATDAELRAGRGSLARLLGYSERRSNEVLRELNMKGYVDFDTVGGGRPTRVIIQRRALVNARASQFARIASVAQGSLVGSAVRLTHVGKDTFTVSVGLSQAGVGLSQGRSRTFPGQTAFGPSELAAPRPARGACGPLLRPPSMPSPTMPSVSNSWSRAPTRSLLTLGLRSTLSLWSIGSGEIGRGLQPSVARPVLPQAKTIVQHKGFRGGSPGRLIGWSWIGTQTPC